MMRVVPQVSAVENLENLILTESLRRVANVRSDVAMVMAEILEADERELVRSAHVLRPDEALFALNLVGEEVISETGGQA